MNASYETVILRESNIRYVSDVTGHSKKKLRLMLAQARKEGRFEVKIPIGIDVFTREER